MTLGERNHLHREHRSCKHKRHADRIKTILYLDRGLNYPEVAALLLLDESTIRSYRKQYDSGGLPSLLSDNNKGRSSFLKEVEISKLKAHLSQNLYASSKPILLHIQQEYGVTYTESGVKKLLHKIGFVYKKPKHIPSKADASKQAAFLEQYAQIKANKKEEDHILFMDGCHPMHNSQPAYGWIKKGEEKGIPANTGRSRVNINGAYNIEKHEAIVREDERINAQSTIALMRQLTDHYPTGKMFIILDNARYYKCNLVKDFIEQNKDRIELVFLPPYSPNLNLIERLWGFFKSKITHNRFYEKFALFKEKTMDFFQNLDQYQQELTSLMTENFQRIPNMILNHQ